MEIFSRFGWFVLTAGLLATAQADTLWRQFGFTAAHTSFNDSETALNPSNVSSLTLLWRSDTFRAVATSPIIGRNLVFVATDGRVHAFDRQTGNRAWARLSCSGEGTQQPAFGRDLLLVGDGGGDLAAYKPFNGNQLWCDDQSGSIVSPPALADDTVFITNGSEVIAIDIFTARQHWRFHSADFIRLTTTPAIANGVVFVTGESSVFALDGITGKKIWRTDLPTQANISSASVANGIVYVGGTDLFALSATGGHLIWQTHSVGVNVSTPAIADGRVFVNSQDPDFGLWAFDAVNGAFLWNNGKPGEPLTTVTVANGVVYDLSEFGDLMMFDTVHGKFLGSIKDPEGFSGAQAVVSDGKVYVSAGDHLDAFGLP